MEDPQKADHPFFVTMPVEEKDHIQGDGREMEGRWKGDGREMGGRWKGDGREMEGRWKGDGKTQSWTLISQAHKTAA